MSFAVISWDYDPEFRDGDLSNLKDIHFGVGDTDNYQPSMALRTLCQVYKFWIAYADIDGFRVDTVKHMDLGAISGKSLPVATKAVSVIRISSVNVCCRLYRGRESLMIKK
jgi:glycosidase